jgi:hypothetical protein
MGDQPSRIWVELRRRRVVSTAAEYPAVSFVSLQLGEILFPAFDLGSALAVLDTGEEVDLRMALS